MIELATDKGGYPCSGNPAVMMMHEVHKYYPYIEIMGSVSCFQCRESLSWASLRPDLLTSFKRGTHIPLPQMISNVIKHLYI